MMRATCPVLALPFIILIVFGTHYEALQYAFNVHGSVHRNNIPTYIQQDAILHSLFYLEIALYISGGTIKQLYLQHLVFVTL